MDTEAATFEVRSGGLVLVELADGVSSSWVAEHIDAPYWVGL